MQTDNGNKYALAALKHKRASLAGEIVSLEKSLAWKRSQLEHVDATLAIFGEADPDKVKPVKPYKRIALFKQGELAQLVRDALRKAAKPLTLSQVVANVTAELGHGEEAIPAMRHRVRASLQYLSREKHSVTKQGNGSRVLWTLAATATRDSQP
ncbi:MAG TPA: hypothetical protein VHU18_08115 [Rhizomicrobium sp.]|jgi:hypothetical protein|nr:hypothetical protein [Rhizomicrobium sp.]